MSTAHPGRPSRLAPDPAWAARGACASHPEPDLWFTPDGDEPRRQRAVAICQACPVQEPCLGYALSVPGLDGIWAGTTKTMRTRLRKRNTRQHNAA